MYVVLLTGGLASGKSTVAKMLATMGATVLDLDDIAKEAQEDEMVLGQLETEFGSDIISSDGTLNRQLLAQRAFVDRESTGKLNAICWPPVKQRVTSYILSSSCLPMEKSELLVIQIPLLAEAPDFLDLKDEVITVSASEALRLKRAITRGMSLEDAQNRLALQASDEEREAISDTAFNNDGSLQDLEAQVKDWYVSRVDGRML